jgi:hypothetical protein
LFAIVGVPIAAKAITSWVRNEYSQSRFWTIEENFFQINSTSNGIVWVVVIVLMASILLRSGRALDPQAQGNVFDKNFFPVQAVSWLENHPQQGHMFNEFDWGGYLLLRLWPSQQIFMDGHTHIYGEALTREYEQVVTLSKGWEDVLQKYDVRWAILRINTPLATRLSTSSNWKKAYQDTTAIIFVRK